MASRYGSMKQVQGFGPGGETIMDYSVYDAIRSGFGKVVFIIRRDFAEEFRKIIEPKLKGRIAVDYVYQELDAFTQGYKAPAGRTKPWGTAHAVLCAKKVIHEPFAAINADDFYGKESFQKAHDFLLHECRDELYSIIGYELIKTLSENGSVSRGVCEVDKAGYLLSVIERTKIYSESNKIFYEDKNGRHEAPIDAKASMNFWCFAPSAFELIEKIFLEFLKENGNDPRSEFFIPIIGEQFIKAGGKIKLIPTSSQWFGVTYKEDAPGVQKSLDDLVKKGEYPVRLWK